MKFDKHEIQQVNRSFNHTRDRIRNYEYIPRDAWANMKRQNQAIAEFNEKANLIITKMKYHG